MNGHRGMVRTGWVPLLVILVVLSPALAQLDVVGSLDTTPRTAVDLDTRFAYAVGANSLIVVDITQPSEPDVVGQVSPGVAALLSVDVEGAFAYCAGQTSGLVIIDVSNPNHPVWVENLNLPTPATHASASGDRVAVATPIGVYLIDVGDPENPEVLDSYGRAATWVEFDGPSADIHCGSNTGAFVLEVNGGSLSLRDQYGSLALSPVTLADPYVDLARGSELQAIDMERYELLGTYQAQGSIRGMAGAAGHSFVGVATGAVTYLDQTGETPRFVASASVSAAITGVAVDPTSRIVAVSHTTGITILEYEILDAPEPICPLPSRFSLGVYPNPFNSRATMQISVPVAGSYHLTVYDVLGRAVLAEDLELAGTAEHPLNLSGNSAGIYWVDLTGQAGSVSRRLVYVP